GHKDFQSFALPTELWHHCGKTRLQLPQLPARSLDPQQGSHPVATRSGKHFVSIASAKVNKISEPANK
ncbi:hypothetical protein, partial [uncultured Alistipes sp.]|uniref:hypothetical protein n=1 Tax=uncultured Alistipes sp. TaxID=538949 RepID=UPI00265B5E9D